MIWLMMKAAIKPPIMSPNPPSTQIMKMSGPKVVPMRRGGQPGRPPADRRGDQIDAPLVDAHQADDVAVLGDRPDRGADESAPQEKIESDRADQRHRERQEACRAHVDVAKLDD